RCTESPAPSSRSIAPVASAMNARSSRIDERQRYDPRNDCRSQMVHTQLFARALRAAFQHGERDRDPELGAAVARSDMALGQRGWRLERNLCAHRQLRAPIERRQSYELQPPRREGARPPVRAPPDDL